MILGDKIKKTVFGVTLASAVFLGVANVGEASPTSMGQESYSQNVLVQQVSNVNDDISVNKANNYDEEYFKSPEYLNSIKGVHFTDNDLKKAPFLQCWEGMIPLVVDKTNFDYKNGNDGFTDIYGGTEDPRFFDRVGELKGRFESHSWNPTQISHLNQSIVRNKSAVMISAEAINQKAWLEGKIGIKSINFKEPLGPGSGVFNVERNNMPYESHSDFKDYKPLMLNNIEYQQFKSVFPEGLTMRNAKLVPYFAQHNKNFNRYFLKDIPDITAAEYISIKRINPKAFSDDRSVSKALETQFASLDNSYGIQGMKQMSTASLGTPSYHSETIKLDSFRVPQNSPFVAMRYAQMIARLQLQKEGKSYSEIVPQNLAQNKDGTFSCNVVCKVRDNVQAKEMSANVANQQYELSDGVLRGQNMNDFLRTTGNSAVADYREMLERNGQQPGDIKLGYDGFSPNEFAGDLPDNRGADNYRADRGHYFDGVNSTKDNDNIIVNINAPAEGVLSKSVVGNRIDDNVTALSRSEIEFIENYIVQEKDREVEKNSISVGEDVKLGERQYMDYGNGKGMECVRCEVQADSSEKASDMAKTIVAHQLTLDGRLDEDKSSLSVIGKPVLKDGTYQVDVKADNVLPEKKQIVEDKKYEPFSVKEVMSKADDITKNTTALADAKFSGNDNDISAASKTFDSGISVFRSVVESKCNGDKAVMSSFDKFVMDVNSVKQMIMSGNTFGLRDSMQQTKGSYDYFSSQLVSYGRIQDIKASGTILSPDMPPDTFYKVSVNKAMKEEGLDINNAQAIGTKALVKQFGVPTSEMVLKNVAPNCVDANNTKFVINSAKKSIEIDKKAEKAFSEFAKNPKQILAKIEPKKVVRGNNDGLEF